ncbi:MAG: 30S ribosomal protein S19e [Methanomicrobiales archaeon]|nr:30S ribosomal protein S19e [Methanomicrobiales archaeon]
MTTAYDIPPALLIRQVGEELKKRHEITPPPWAGFVKTGVHREMEPEQPDWWYIRAASVLRRLYVDGPVGVQRLRSVYGGKRDRGSRPNRFRKGSGAILRKILQQLETAGLAEKDRSRRGRNVTPAGREFLDNIAHAMKGGVASAAQSDQ